jgi:putative PIN family toxin of toxin-antitoxin system
VTSWLGGAFDWVITEALLVELNRSLRYGRVQRRHGWSEQQIQDYVRRIRRNGVSVEPRAALDVLTRDPSDNRLLQAAVAGDADYIVTGDRLLLDLGEYEGTRIVTPARFVAILAGREL